MPQTQTLRDEAALILAEFDAEDRDLLQPIVEDYLDLYQDKAHVAPRLQYTYALRKCVDKLLKSKYKDVTYTDAGVSESLGQMADTLEKMRAELDADILQMEGQARANRAPAIGQMVKTAPVSPVCGAPDPNSPRFRGDPRYPGGWRP